jgi:hypothetical protein
MRKPGTISRGFVERFPTQGRKTIFEEIETGNFDLRASD